MKSTIPSAATATIRHSQKRFAEVSDHTASLHSHDLGVVDVDARPMLKEDADAWHEIRLVNRVHLGGSSGLLVILHNLLVQLGPVSVHTGSLGLCGASLLDELAGVEYSRKLSGQLFLRCVFQRRLFVLRRTALRRPRGRWIQQHTVQAVQGLLVLLSRSSLDLSQELLGCNANLQAQRSSRSNRLRSHDLSG